MTKVRISNDRDIVTKTLNNFETNLKQDAANRTALMSLGFNLTALSTATKASSRRLVLYKNSASMIKN